jgi:hypothetical protein
MNLIDKIQFAFCVTLLAVVPVGIILILNDAFANVTIQ